MERAAEGVRRALSFCLGVKNEETLLVLTDEGLADLGRLFYEEGCRLTPKTEILTMAVLDRDGMEPVGEVAAALLRADVAVLVTSRSLSHTRARQNASMKGARIASMPGLTEGMLAGALLADYDEMARRSRRYAEDLTAAQAVRITTEAGTDLRFSLQDRKGLADTGEYSAPGAFGNLPAGEAFIAPLEGSAEGILVIDGSMGGVGIPAAPLALMVEGGHAVKINGGEEARRLAAILAAAGTNAGNIAEFGVGTNNAAALHGEVLEDEKVLGTIHIALGDNANFGGTVEAACHLDGIVTAPTVYLDGRLWLDKGEYAPDRQ